MFWLKTMRLPQSTFSTPSHDKLVTCKSNDCRPRQATFPLGRLWQSRQPFCGPGSKRSHVQRTHRNAAQVFPGASPRRSTIMRITTTSKTPMTTNLAVALHLTTPRLNCCTTPSRLRTRKCGSTWRPSPWLLAAFIPLNQRVELKSSKLAAMERARREGMDTGSSSRSSQKGKERDVRELENLA